MRIKEALAVQKDKEKNQQAQAEQVESTSEAEDQLAEFKPETDKTALDSFYGDHADETEQHTEEDDIEEGDEEEEDEDVEELP